MHMHTKNYVNLMARTLFIPCLHATKFGYTITTGIYIRGDKRQHVYLN
jgi:hypothetical protein